MKLDRELQLEILNSLAAEYPSWLTSESPSAEFEANCWYLFEHGLVELGLTTKKDRHTTKRCKITAAGMDFMADDGGLGSILGVVEVRLHADTVIALIGSRIDDSDLPSEQKGAIKSRLSDLPKHALHHLTSRLIDLALDQGPASIALIQKAAGL